MESEISYRFASPKGQIVPFETVRGLKGKVYVPEQPAEEARKHTCDDCYACQLCSDDRCSVCRNGKESCRCDNPDQP
jgi:hypothetical protein